MAGLSDARHFAVKTAHYLDKLLGFFDIGALESDDDGLFHPNIGRCVDHTHCNHIASDDATSHVVKHHIVSNARTQIPHNASKYIDQDRLHLFVRIEKLESLLHLRFRGASSNIQEVCGIASFKLQAVQIRNTYEVDEIYQP